MLLVNQMAEADVNSVEGMLGARPETIGGAAWTSSELPACRLRRVPQCIQENLQRELPLAELSALVHMSPYHFARLFTRSTGAPPHKFLVQRRIDRAQALLAARPAPISEISRLVGFRTPSHFTTTFSADHRDDTERVLPHRGRRRGGGRPASATSFRTKTRDDGDRADYQRDYAP